MIKNKLYTLIVTLILFIFSFNFPELNVLDRVLIMILLILLWIFGVMSFRKEFLNEIGYYSLGYFTNLILFLLFSIYLLISKYLPAHNKIYFIIPISSLSFILFISTGIFPYLRYKGLQISLPKKIRVPKGLIYNLVFNLQNNKPFDCVAEVNITLPSNVSFDDGTIEKRKKVSIKANHTLPLRLRLKSIENKQSRITFLIARDETGKEIKKKIELIT